MVSPLDQKTRMSTLSLVLREKFHLNSAHPDLHKAIYVLCVPSLLAALNAAIYYLSRGEANWSTTNAAAWTVDTYAAPWISFTANVAATVVFIILSRHRRVRSHTKIAIAAVLTLAWLGTFVSFLVVA